jgi:hypothetical protein
VRKGTFGFQLVPLPRSLQLSATDNLQTPVISPNGRGRGAPHEWRAQG